MIFIIFGIISIVMMVLAFTSQPFWTRYWLGTSNAKFKYKPEYIIMLGAGNMPCEASLMRLYYTAELAKTDTTLKVIIAQPKDSNNIAKIRTYLMSSGVDSSRILFETTGKSTRQQILKIALAFPEVIESKNVIVTSPEHMRRSVFAFRKFGYKHIGGIAAFENSSKISFDYDAEKLGGKKYIPNVGGSLSLRYNFWNYLNYEIICIREFVAIGYYWIQGWI